MEKEFYEAGKNYNYQIIEDEYKNFIFLRGIFEKFGKISKRNLINSKLCCTIEIFNENENNLFEYLNYFEFFFYFYLIFLFLFNFIVVIYLKNNF